MSTFENATPTTAIPSEVVAEFVRLSDAAIAEAERQRTTAVAAGAVPGRLEQLDKLLRHLQAYKAHGLAGTLPLSRGARLGLSRFAGEWNEEPELLDRLYPVDNFYQDYM